MTLRYRTAGESHGPCLVTVVEGLPYGLPFDPARIDAALARRQGGYGRGARQKMEHDTVEVLAGIRQGRTVGGPLVLRVANRVKSGETLGPIAKPRPGHADLPGTLKFGLKDARDISERASARETAARVAAGAVAAQILAPFDIEALGYVVAVGGAASAVRLDDPAEIRRRREASLFYALDPAQEATWTAAVDAAKAAGDTVGGVFEVAVFGCPPGLGSHVQWDRKLDTRLAAALMSIQSVKGIEIGDGFAEAARRGSEAHDAVRHESDGKIRRATNRAGGIEGGMTNGMPVVVRAASKPISTLREGLPTIDLATGGPARAQYERSDTCIAPAASVVGEAAVALEIAAVFLEKFGGDAWDDVRRGYDAYAARVRNYF
jgi:chorismate synthase